MAKETLNLATVLVGEEKKRRREKEKKKDVVGR